MPVRLIGGPLNGDAHQLYAHALSEGSPQSFCHRSVVDARWHHYESTLYGGEYIYCGVCEDIAGEHHRSAFASVNARRITVEGGERW